MLEKVLQRPLYRKQSCVDSTCGVVVIWTNCGGLYYHTIDDLDLWCGGPDYHTTDNLDLWWCGGPNYHTIDDLDLWWSGLPYH